MRRFYARVLNRLFHRTCDTCAWFNVECLFCTGHPAGPCYRRHMGRVPE
jgi:hypothetical protein